MPFSGRCACTRSTKRQTTAPTGAFPRCAPLPAGEGAACRGFCGPPVPHPRSPALQMVKYCAKEENPAVGESNRCLQSAETAPEPPSVSVRPQWQRRVCGRLSGGFHPSFRRAVGVWGCGGPCGTAASDNGTSRRAAERQKAAPVSLPLSSLSVGVCACHSSPLRLLSSPSTPLHLPRHSMQFQPAHVL